MKHAVRHNAVALFVRHPVPGRVKTRLACDLGAAAACDLYRCMVADCIASVSSAGLPLYLFHDGQEDAGLPQEWARLATDVIGQTGDTLGERMTNAFEFLFSTGMTQVVLTGSDVPGIDSALLRSAITALGAYDVAFSPAIDGGYCLVASQKNRFNRLIFESIPWSTAVVMEKTVAACKAGGLSYTMLEPRQDIDKLEDVVSYCRRPAPVAQRTNAWLTSHGYMMPPLGV